MSGNEPAKKGMKRPMGKAIKVLSIDAIIIPVTEIEDKRLNLKDKGLLAYLHYYQDGEEISVRRLSECIETDGMASISNSVKRLERFGYLTRTRKRRENGKFGQAVWTLSNASSIEHKEGDDV